MERGSDLVREMNRLSWLGSTFNAALAAQIGIAPTDLMCLTLLRETGAAAAGELAEALGLTTGAITGVIDRLETAGYVSRQSDPDDRRRVMVEAVPDRLQELSKSYEPLVAAAGQALADYSDVQIELLFDYHRRANRMLQDEIGRLRSDSLQMRAGRRGTREFSAALQDVEAGRLEFANGASRVTIHAGAQPTELYHAYVEGPEPEVVLNDAAIAFHYRRVGLFDWNRHAADISLNANIAWVVALREGASKVTVDARALRLGGLCLDGGASEVTVLLGQPQGSVRLDIHGGVSRLRIARPAEVPLELRVRGGASRLEMDDQRFGAIGGEVRLASPGFEAASDRYQLEIAGGASRLEIIAASQERLAYWPGLPGKVSNNKTEVG